MKTRNFTAHGATLAAAACAALAIVIGSAAPAKADAPFCVENYSRVGMGKQCRFYTYAQCVAYTSGIGGSCSANPWYRYPEQRQRRVRRHLPR